LKQDFPHVYADVHGAMPDDEFLAGISEKQRYVKMHRAERITMTRWFPNGDIEEAGRWLCKIEPKIQLWPTPADFELYRQDDSSSGIWQLYN
jgi:hypothetical protein